MKRLIAIGLLVGGLSVASAQIYDFTMSLDGPQEGGATPSGALGTGTASYDSLSGILSLTVSFSGLSNNASASHVHLGAAGVGGGVIYQGWTTPAATSGTITYSGPNVFPAANVPDLLAGNTYFNIHSQPLYPGGEIRGQLQPVPEPTTATLAALALGILLWQGRRRLRT